MFARLNTVLCVAALIGFAIACLSLLCSILWHLFKKRWKRTGATLVTTGLLCIEIYFVAGATLAMMMMGGPIRDHFADNLTIPEGIEITAPIARDVIAGSKKDDFQAAVLAALVQPSEGDSTITANINSLIALYQNEPAALRRYLSMSPAWFVSQIDDEGTTAAARRWQINSNWQHSSDGRYSNFDLSQRPARTPAFNLQVRIVFSATPRPASKFKTFIAPGETAALSLSESEQGLFSQCVIGAEGLSVEISEVSEGAERKMTKAALTFLENELAPLAANPTEATIRENLPPESIQQGGPDIALREMSQPGHYQVIGQLNPGDRGSVYLKAFEVTKGTQLSKVSLQAASTEQIGWSDNAAEQFLFNTSFVIYEGDWGDNYAARFEVWLAPGLESKAIAKEKRADRKLLDKNFKIEGWQH